MTHLALALAMTLAAAPAPKPGNEMAKRLFVQAQRLYKAGEYKQAIGVFEKAWELKAAPAIRYNIGKCYEKLGDIRNALREYRAYLRAAPTASDRDEVMAAASKMEEQLKLLGVQQLAVLSDPEDANVQVDGKDLGPAPVTIELAPGRHKVKVSKDGFQVAEKTFIMADDRSMELSFALKPGKAAPDLDMPPPPAPKSSSSKPSTTISAPVAAVPTQAQVQKSEAPSRVPAYAVGGGAVAVGALGAVFGIMAGGAASSLHNTIHSGKDAQALASQANSMALAANVSYGVAAGAAVTAAVLFFLESRASAPQTTSRGGSF